MPRSGNASLNFFCLFRPIGLYGKGKRCGLPIQHCHRPQKPPNETELDLFVFVIDKEIKNILLFVLPTAHSCFWGIA